MINIKTENNRFKKRMALKLTKATSMFRKSAKETKKLMMEKSNKISNEMAPTPI